MSLAMEEIYNKICEATTDMTVSERTTWREMHNRWLSDQIKKLFDEIVAKFDEAECARQAANGQSSYMFWEATTDTYGEKQDFKVNNFTRTCNPLSFPFLFRGPYSIGTQYFTQRNIASLIELLSEHFHPFEIIVNRSRRVGVSWGHEFKIDL